MSVIKGCGLLASHENFFIDHLAPLCSLLSFPIITPYPEHLFKHARYYPDVKIFVKDCSLESILKNYTHLLYSSEPTPSILEMIKQQKIKDPKNPIWQKELKLIYHFHGCSDKGYHSKWISPNSHIKDLDLLIYYGKRFETLLKDKNLFHLPKKTWRIGNYRYQYYLKHQLFYDEITHREIFSKFKKNQKVLFYAPTWQDAERSSSFKFVLPWLRSQKDGALNILIKPHPNLFEQYPHEIHQLREWVKTSPNLLLIENYPLIYPLLSRSDYYLGDHSSVNYDALSFDKPLFFINSQKRSASDLGAQIFKAGYVIDPQEIASLEKIIARAPKQSYEMREKFYHEFMEDNFSENNFSVPNI